jgi:hypothetical protein
MRKASAAGLSVKVAADSGSVYSNVAIVARRV